MDVKVGDKFKNVFKDIELEVQWVPTGDSPTREVLVRRNNGHWPNSLIILDVWTLLDKSRYERVIPKEKFVVLGFRRADGSVYVRVEKECNKYMALQLCSPGTEMVYQHEFELEGEARC